VEAWKKLTTDLVSEMARSAEHERTQAVHVPMKAR
jgi:hypothetical protein